MNSKVNFPMHKVFFLLYVYFLRPVLLAHIAVHKTILDLLRNSTKTKNTCSCI